MVPPILDRLVTPRDARELEPVPVVPPPTVNQAVTPATPSERTITPEVVTPPPDSLQPEAPAAKPPVAPTIERLPAEAPPIPAPIATPSRPEPVAPPKVEPAATRPIERAPMEAPAVPAPLPALPATPPVRSAPLEVPALPVPLLETVTSPASELTKSIAPQVRSIENVPVPELPQEIPAAPALPSPAPPQAAPALPAQAAPTLPAQVAPAVTAPAAPAELPKAPGVPSAPEAPSAQPQPAATPAPEPLFPREGPSSSTYDPTKPASPHINLDSIRERAGEIAREGTGSRAVLAFPMPPVPPKKSKLESAIENARKPDCRTAYAGLGLLAALPLIANEIGEGTCRW